MNSIIDPSMDKAKVISLIGESTTTEAQIIAALKRPDGLDSLISDIDAERANFNSDTSTPKGRGEIKSFAYKFTRIKTRVDAIRKAVIKDSMAEINAINATCKRFRDLMDKYNEEERKPLTDWEEIEAERIKQHENEILKIVAMGHITRHDGTPVSLDQLKIQMEKLEAVNFTGNKWEEFNAKAEQVMFQSYRRVQKAIIALVKRESEQRELKRLQDQEEERKQIVAEAEEKARQELHDKQIAEKAKEDEKHKRIAAEERAKEAEKEAKNAKERERQAGIDAEHRREQQEERAKEAADRRVKQEAIRKRHEESERKANDNHVIAVQSRAVRVLVENGIKLKDAEKVIKMIHDESVPNVTIKY